MNDKMEYFTAGELAELYHISKQTLIYYDRIDLLKPEHVSANGYRYYHIKQYLDLEIIINLRKLNLPIEQIKRYLDNRSMDNFKQLIEDKSREYQQRMEALNELNHSLTNVKLRLESYNNIILDQIMLFSMPATYLKITCLEPSLTDKERVTLFAKHCMEVQQEENFKEKNVGWIIMADNFLNNPHQQHTVAYYSVPVAYSDADENLFCRDEGLCLRLDFSGVYFQKAVQLSEQIGDFLKRNKLIPRDNVYIIPIKNHWYTNDTDKYINRLILPVKTVVDDI